MYVWRIPLVYFAVLTATIAVVMMLSFVIEARRRAASSLLRGVLTSAGIVGVVASPALVNAIADTELRRLVKLGVFAYHGFPVFVAPAVVAGMLLVVCHLLFPAGRAASMNWRLRYWAVALAFGVLNLANWCSPGWCERYGFPFPYSWWSDAIIIMNGENLTAGTSALAVVANAGVFLFVVGVMSRAYRRATVKPQVEPIG